MASSTFNVLKRPCIEERPATVRHDRSRHHAVDLDLIPCSANAFAIAMMAALIVATA
jgi:hypothetical protein